MIYTEYMMINVEITINMKTFIFALVFPSGK